MLKCYLLDKILPNQEYVLDLKSVLDQVIRIIHVSFHVLVVQFAEFFFAGNDEFGSTKKLA